LQHIPKIEKNIAKLKMTARTNLGDGGMKLKDNLDWLQKCFVGTLYSPNHVFQMQNNLALEGWNSKETNLLIN